MSLELLNGDCFLLILRQLNLNERSNVRLVNKRFRNLCDSVWIKKLIVFDNLMPVTGRLPYTNESYGLRDCVYVTDLEKFFANTSPVLKCLERIKVLMIICTRIKSRPFNIDQQFDQLTHLWLKDVFLSTPEILKSRNIEHLSISGTALKPVTFIAQQIGKYENQYGAEADKIPYSTIFGFDAILSKRIQVLTLTEKMNLEFAKRFVKQHQFDHLEQLDTNLVSFETLLYLNDHCPSLKKLNFQMYGDITGFLENAASDDLQKIAQKLRDDLKVFVFHFPFNRSTASRLIKIFALFGDSLKFANSRLKFNCTMSSIKLLKKLDEEYDLSEFFSSIKRFLLLDQHAFDERLVMKLVNCDSFFCLLLSPPSAALKRVFSNFTNLQTVSIFNHSLQVQYTREFFDLIAQKDSICYLTILNFEKIEWNFLLKLPRLVLLDLHLYHPFDLSLLIEVVKNCKDLREVRIEFFQPQILTIDDFSSFKKKVYEELRFLIKDDQRSLKDRFANKLILKITFLLRKNDRYIRILLKHVDYPRSIFPQTDTLMFNAFAAKRKSSSLDRHT